MLKANMEMRLVFINSGKFALTLAVSLSFENQYRLNFIVTDFAGDIDLILVPIQARLRVNQADIMTTDDERKRGSPTRPTLTMTTASTSVLGSTD
ncbi:phage tail protein [Enterobacter quasiroggenkampii]|uniref:phage tail protein n=1 Tax=Enterobacter quasiroggenkampii TaxID=2497436 RepID=UPI0039C3BF17